MMALLEIIRPEFECHGHHRHFSPSPSHAIGPVLVEFAGAVNLGNIDRTTTETSRVNTDSEKGELTMSAKMKLATLAALLSALSAHGPASAQNYFTTFPSASEYQSNQAVKRLKAKIPTNAHGSVTGTTMSPRARPFETDPDPNVRFEMNRDDRDRRAGG